MPKIYPESNQQPEFMMHHERTLPPGTTLGLDAEFVIRSKKTGLPVSMIDKIGGVKEFPKRVKHGALQEDGVLAEINIDPVKDFYTFERNLSSVLHSLQEICNKYDYYIDFNSICAKYPESELMDFRALEAGCEPDYCAFTGEQRPKPEFTSTLRTCGGHIHFGIPYPDSKPFIRRQLVGLAEIGIGLPLAIVEPPNDRRRLYGSFGSYRPKSYGVEIRSPSNHWLTKAYLRKFTFSRAQQILWSVSRINSYKRHEELAQLKYNFDALQKYPLSKYITGLPMSSGIGEAMTVHQYFKRQAHLLKDRRSRRKGQTGWTADMKYYYVDVEPPIRLEMEELWVAAEYIGLRIVEVQEEDAEALAQIAFCLRFGNEQVTQKFIPGLYNTTTKKFHKSYQWKSLIQAIEALTGTKFWSNKPKKVDITNTKIHPTWDNILNSKIGSTYEAEWVDFKPGEQ